MYFNNQEGIDFLKKENKKLRTKLYIVIPLFFPVFAFISFLLYEKSRIYYRYDTFNGQHNGSENIFICVLIGVFLYGIFIYAFITDVIFFKSIIQTIEFEKENVIFNTRKSIFNDKEIFSKINIKDLKIVKPTKIDEIVLKDRDYIKFQIKSKNYYFIKPFWDESEAILNQLTNTK